MPIPRSKQTAEQRIQAWMNGLSSATRLLPKSCKIKLEKGGTKQVKGRGVGSLMVWAYAMEGEQWANVVHIPSGKAAAICRGKGDNKAAATTLLPAVAILPAEWRAADPVKATSPKNMLLIPDATRRLNRMLTHWPEPPVSAKFYTDTLKVLQQLGVIDG